MSEQVKPVSLAWKLHRAGFPKNHSLELAKLPSIKTAWEAKTSKEIRAHITGLAKACDVEHQKGLQMVKRFPALAVMSPEQLSEEIRKINEVVGNLQYTKDAVAQDPTFLQFHPASELKKLTTDFALRVLGVSKKELLLEMVVNPHYLGLSLSELAKRLEPKQKPPKGSWRKRQEKEEE